MKLAIALIVVVVLQALWLAATPDESGFLSRYAEEPYVLTDCQMQVVVSEYNVLAVTETYQVYLNEASHGIYCYLPLRLTLPDGYFKSDYTKYYLTIAMIAALPALAARTVLVLFLKFGRDKRYAPTVEFYPPEGLNSAEVGLWYKGKAADEMVLFLLVCLAQEGGITIVPAEFKRDFVITKRRDYTGQDTNMALFMDGLFPDGRTRTDYYKLKDDFYKTVDTIRADLNSTESRSCAGGTMGSMCGAMCSLTVCCGIPCGQPTTVWSPSLWVAETAA